MLQNLLWLDQVSWRTQFFEISIFKNGYPLPLIDNCFKTIADKLFINRPQLISVEKKTLFLPLQRLGEISLQTRTKLRKSLEALLNSCKLQIAFKGHRKVLTIFRFKDCLPSDLVSGVVYKYTRGRCNSTNYGETGRQLKLALENILGYHLWHLRKPNHQSSAQSTTIFWIAITSRLLRSLPFWPTGIIAKFY